MVYAFQTLNGQWSKLRFTSEVDLLRHAKRIQNLIGREAIQTPKGFEWNLPGHKVNIEKVDVKSYLNA